MSPWLKVGAAAWVLFGCARKPESVALPTPSGAAVEVPSAAPRPPASAGPSVVQREASFDGGVARIETSADGTEHVSLVATDGGVLSESTCVGRSAGYDAVRAFFSSVQRAILKNDAATVADMIALPLRVNAKTPLTIHSRDEFLGQRSRILTPDVIERVRDADPAQVFCNVQGVMFGDGVLWADLQPNDRLAIEAINVGPAAQHRHAK